MLLRVYPALFLAPPSSLGAFSRAELARCGSVHGRPHRPRRSTVEGRLGFDGVSGLAYYSVYSFIRGVSTYSSSVFRAVHLDALRDLFLMLYTFITQKGALPMLCTKHLLKLSSRRCRGGVLGRRGHLAGLELNADGVADGLVEQLHRETCSRHASRKQ